MLWSKQKALFSFAFGGAVLFFVFFAWTAEVRVVSTSGNGTTRKSALRKCALVVYGVRMETLNVGGSSIRANIVEALDCDVFVYGREEEGAIDAVKKAFPRDRLKGVYFGRQSEQDEVLASLRAGSNWTQLNQACKDSNMLLPGTLNGLLWTQRAFEMMATHEKVADVAYTHVIFIRPDIEVFARLPPLSLFSSAYDLHFPTRTTWGGVPASLVVCLRDRCGFWAQLFEMLRNGTAVNHLVRANLLTARNCAASEIFEWNLFAAMNLKIGWFSVVHAILCAKHLCTKGDQCFAGKSICLPGVRYKYDRGNIDWFEKDVASRNAARIRRSGWTNAEMQYNGYLTRGNIREHWNRGISMPANWGKYNALHPAPPFTPLDPF